MSHAIRELTGILTAGQATTTGTVTGKAGEYVTIATARGNLQARPAGTLTTGDRVIVRAGWAEKVPKATMSYSV